MIAAHRIVEAKHIGARAEPAGRIPEPGHRLGQQRRHDIGMELPGEFTPAYAAVGHRITRPDVARILPAIFSGTPSMAALAAAARRAEA